MEWVFSESYNKFHPFWKFESMNEELKEVEGKKTVIDSKQPPVSNGCYIVFHLPKDIVDQRIPLKPGYNESLLLKTLRNGFLLILKKIENTMTKYFEKTQKPIIGEENSEKFENWKIMVLWAGLLHFPKNRTWLFLKQETI